MAIRLLCLQTMSMDSENAGICKQLGYKKNLAVCHQMCISQPPYVKTEVGLLRDHSQHTITAITKWLERLAFLVLI